MSVGYKSGSKSYTLTPRRKHIGKAVARGGRKSVVDECFKDPESRKYVVRKFGSLMQSEMKTMCSEKVDSILCRKTVDALAGFQWIQ